MTAIRRKWKDCPYQVGTKEYEKWIRQQPENKAKAKIKAREYYLRNREKCIAYRRAQLVREKEARALAREGRPISAYRLQKISAHRTKALYAYRVATDFAKLLLEGVQPQELVSARRAKLNRDKQERWMQNTIARAKEGDADAVHNLWKKTPEGIRWRHAQLVSGLPTTLAAKQSPA